MLERKIEEGPAIGRNAEVGTGTGFAQSRPTTPNPGPRELHPRDAASRDEGEDREMNHSKWMITAVTALAIFAGIDSARAASSKVKEEASLLVTGADDDARGRLKLQIRGGSDGGPGRPAGSAPEEEPAPGRHDVPPGGQHEGPDRDRGRLEQADDG